VRPSHRDYCRAEPHPEEWLLIEWPAGDTEPSKYWLSTLPATTALVDLVLSSPLTNRAGAESMHVGVVQFET
jgi:hypothetical protein